MKGLFKTFKYKGYVLSAYKWGIRGSHFGIRVYENNPKEEMGAVCIDQCDSYQGAIAIGKAFVDKLEKDYAKEI